MDTVYDWLPKIDAAPRRDLANYREIQDDYFKECYSICKRYSMLHIPAFYNMFTSLKYISENSIQGDIVECGCFLGGSSLFLLMMCDYFGLENRNIFIYDTFYGFPSEEKDKFYDKEFLSSDFSDGSINFRQAFERNISRHADLKRIAVIEGKVEETLSVPPSCELSLLRLDTDFYNSTKVELEVLYPLLRSGGVLIVDDFGSFEGSRRATEEYFAANPPSPLLSRIDHGTVAGTKPGPLETEKGAHYAFVQIGAHVGDEALEYAQRGEKCLLVEPMPTLFEQLQKRFAEYPNVLVVNVAISDRVGPKDFHYLKDTSGLPWWADQISSLSHKHILALGKGANFKQGFEERIEARSVCTITPMMLLDRYHVESIGTLFIDTEGHDARIIMALNLEQIHIQKIIFESKHTDGTRRKGYQFNRVVAQLAESGYNTVSVDHQNESAMLMSDWQQVRESATKKRERFRNTIRSKQKTLKGASGGDRGAIYLAIGRDYHEEVLTSATLLRLNNPDLPITIFTDAPFDDELPFDVTIIQANTSPFKLKVEALSKTPYSKTLFLDTDTFVFSDVEEIFETLSECDFCFAHAPMFGYDENGQFYFKGYENRNVVNTGLLGYTANDRVFDMLELWRSSMVGQCNEEISAGTYCDQWYFNHKVVPSDAYAVLKTATLNNTRWNVRSYAMGRVCEDGKAEQIKVLHAKPWEAKRFWNIDLYDFVLDAIEKATTPHGLFHWLRGRSWNKRKKGS